MKFHFLPEPPVNSEQGPITVEVSIVDVPAQIGTHEIEARRLECVLIVGALRVPCRVDQLPADKLQS